VNAAGLFAVVRQFLLHKILQAWCHMPRAPRLAPKDGNRSGARTVAPDDSIQPVEGRQPSEQVSVSLRSKDQIWFYLCISRVGIEDIGEELACASYPRNHKAMDIVAINDEKLRQVSLTRWLDWRRWQRGR
jgi:hypothetical protein